MDLSIIIVNWNSAEYTRRCVSSILAHVNHLNYEVIIVDNASTDDSYDILRNACPHVTLLRSTENLGFARANNWAYEHSTGEFVLFLNPDTEVISPAITQMHAYLTSTPDVGAVGCRLLNANGSVQTSCIQRFPTILNQLTDIEWLRLRFPQLQIWGIWPLFRPDGPVATEVDVVSGACVMLRRHVFESVGRFSTDYFMYGEDVDLSYKVRKAGWAVCHLSSGSIVHYGKQSTERRSENAFSVVLMRESRFRFLHKTRGAAYAWLYRLSLIAGAIPRLAVCGLLLLPTSPTTRSAFRNTFMKWWSIVRWIVGLEGWTTRLSSSGRSVSGEAH